MEAAREFLGLNVATMNLLIVVAIVVGAIAAAWFLLCFILPMLDSYLKHVEAGRVEEARRAEEARAAEEARVRGGSAEEFVQH